jgi:hypothetical protein
MGSSERVNVPVQLGTRRACVFLFVYVVEFQVIVCAAVVRAQIHKRHGTDSRRTDNNLKRR